ncbi:MAG: 3-phosphoshikimate 1-carboxyvinyltransferase [Gammaproteobacteria bacterium]|nr:3-phosphoshikimate 1-carboxyvinyltransferase [Gammaproteobacteria bacterium]
MASVRNIRRVEKAFDVEVTLPGSKSIALRQLVISALSNQSTELDGLTTFDDVVAMIGALRTFGVRIEQDGQVYRVEPPPSWRTGTLDIDLNMSGVSLRLLLGMAALRTDPTRFDGHTALHARPNSDMLTALEELGVHTESNDGRLPISMTGPRTFESSVTVRTDMSSQYLSGLLLVAPCLPNGLQINLRGERVSAPYISITLAEMAKRGVTVVAGDNVMSVAPQRYQGGNVVIEGDASAASYHAALATLHAGRVRIANLGASTIQGDYGFFAVCEQLGATVIRGETFTEVTGPAKLKPLEQIDMTEMPDAAVTLMAVAPYLPKPTHITGLSTLPHKECDRIACPARELAKAGVTMDVGDDWVRVYPLERLARPASFETYDDHRMAMSMAVFASGADGCQVLDPDCVAKTYGEFWTDFSRIYAA